MIQRRDQELLRQRLARDLTRRVRVDLFTERPSSIIIPGRPECLFCQDVQTLMTELTGLSHHFSLTVHDFYGDPHTAATMGVDVIPAIVFRGPNNRPLRFFGMPTGLQFQNFVEALIEASSGANQLAPETLRQLRKVRDEILLQVLVAPSCEHSPQMALTAFRLAQQNAKVKVSVIEAKEFPTLVQQHGVEATPAIIINGTLVLTGAMDEATLVACLLMAVEGKPLPAASARGPSTPLGVEQAQQELRVTGSGLFIPR